MSSLPFRRPADGDVSRARRRFLPPALEIPDGSLEALKWLALGLMVADHINKYLLGGAVTVLFALGRIAMPVFAMVLAYNLARPGALECGVHVRAMRRLAVAAVVATVPFMALGGLGWGWWPVNIMGTLLVATVTVYLVDKGGKARIMGALVLVLFAGLVVEYWWPALALVVSSWLYFRRPGWPALIGVAAGLAGLYPINHNWWAFAAVPLMLSASRMRICLPRAPRLFYVAYPLHLALIWLVRQIP